MEEQWPGDTDIILNWLREYRREWLRPDVIAGLTTAAVFLPKAMAYATIAGLPVEVRLYRACPHVRQLLPSCRQSARNVVFRFIYAPVALAEPDVDAIAGAKTQPLVLVHRHLAGFRALKSGFFLRDRAD